MARKEKLKNWAINSFVSSFRNTPESAISDRLEADKRLDQLCTLAVIRAGLVGALSGMFVVITAFSLSNWEGLDGMNGFAFNLIIGITGIIATSIELLFLYRDSLNTAARMAKVLDIPDEELSKVEMEQSMPRWLIYAAMGAPGHRGVLFGINPLEKIGKFGLTLRKILIKIRVVGSASLFKSILRRIWVRLIGRIATRAAVEILALPVFIILNVLGMRHTMNEMRSRLVGYELIPKIIEHAFPETLEKISPGIKKALNEGLSKQITAARYIHPNQIRILEILGDCEMDMGTAISVDDQRRADRFLIVISTMSGKNTYRYRKLSREIENRLGSEEVLLVRSEVWDAIHDLKPFSRTWE